MRPPTAVLIVALLAVGATPRLSGQTPQPFPRPSAPGADTAAPQPQPPPAQAPRPPATNPAAPQTLDVVPPPSADPTVAEPTEASLGFPIYPTAQFIASYDAGRSQRFYLFGTVIPYAEIVAYYRTVLRERGDEVFKEPPTHMFEVGRFRDETMAFPPGVTVKDWTWGGSAGYPNPRLSAEPSRFPTVIMIVPAPPTPPGR